MSNSDRTYTMTLTQLEWDMIRQHRDTQIAELNVDKHKLRVLIMNKSLDLVREFQNAGGMSFQYFTDIWVPKMITSDDTFMQDLSTLLSDDGSAIDTVINSIFNVLLKTSNTASRAMYDNQATYDELLIRVKTK